MPALSQVHQGACFFFIDFIIPKTQKDIDKTLFCDIIKLSSKKQFDFRKGIASMKRNFFIFALIVILALELCAPLCVSASAPSGYVIDDARGGYVVYTAQGLFEIAELIDAVPSEAVHVALDVIGY